MPRTAGALTAARLGEPCGSHGSAMARRRLVALVMAIAPWLFAATSSLAIAAPVERGGALEITEAWTRQAPAGQDAVAGYLVIRNTGAETDRLLSAWSPVAEAIELRELTSPPQGSAGSPQPRRAMDGLLVPGSGTLRLEPDGAYIAFIRPKQAFELGDRVPVTLRFERAGTVSVVMPVHGH